ncbi:NrfD/PsrC family molybdoenzyme membrane anchor subunit [Acidianus sp. RZ1]|uniref:NrfD/PsrC family molybdoenzyme membrane anchor subunit n=1 Tax=Acidianus sp. RZ1 TaxID=1540082 RepID=UPI001492396D|nr:NrfD/PsrC family molybdoenzyme membrane anchor subunit [Acidianus sp. RZ1]NON62578.1 polysulfide reductase NrfD [Acidianus sp. RZ1]
MKFSKLLLWTFFWIIIGGTIMLYALSKFTIPNNTPIRWGLLVIGYVFFGVMGTGVSTYNSLYELFNRKDPKKNPLESIKLRAEWLAFAVLVPGWIMVFASVYKPLTMMYIYLSFNDTSRIAWNGLLYVLVGLGIILEIIVLITEKKNNLDKGIINKVLKFLLSFSTYIAGYAVLVELLLDANLGGVFGYLSTWVLDFGPAISILMAILSFYGGIALLTVMNLIYDWSRNKLILSPSISPAKLAKLSSIPGSNKSSVVNSNKEDEKPFYQNFARDGMFSVIGVGFIMLWWTWLMGTNQEDWPWTYLLFFGNYWYVFWLFVVILGLIIPLGSYVLAYKNNGNKKWLLIASVTSLIGMFSMIFLADILPQSISWYYSNSPVSPFNSVWTYEFRSTYITSHQWTFLPFSLDPWNLWWFIGGTLFALGFFTLGILLLPLEENEKPKHAWIFK